MSSASSNSLASFICGDYSLPACGALGLALFLCVALAALVAVIGLAYIKKARIRSTLAAQGMPLPPFTFMGTLPPFMEAVFTMDTTVDMEASPTTIPEGGFTSLLPFQKYVETNWGTVSFQSLGSIVRLRVSDPITAYDILVRKSKSFAKPAMSLQVLSLLAGTGLVASEGRLHATMRRLLQPVFTMAALKDMQPRIAAMSLAGVVDILTQAGASTPSGRVDLHQAMGDLTLTVVCALTMGMETAVDVAPSIRAAGATPPAEKAQELSAATQGKRAMNGVMVDFTDKIVRDVKLLFPILIPNYVNTVPTPDNLAMRAKLKLMEQLTDEIVAQKTKARKASGKPAESPDLCDRLVEAMLDPNTPPDVKAAVTPQQVRSEVQTFALAGQDTTSNLIAWTLACLQRHPAWLARVRAEVDGALAHLLPSVHGAPMPQALLDALSDITANSKTVTPVLEACIRETLRFLPSVPRFEREVKEDVEVRVPLSAMVGCTATPDKAGNVALKLPAGTTVNVVAAALHRNVAWGPDRYTFNPGRFIDDAGAYCTEKIPGLAWAPFAAGNRKCIGYNLALMEARGILAAMILLAEWESPAEDQHIGTVALVCRPRDGLPVTVGPRAGVCLPGAGK